MKENLIRIGYVGTQSEIKSEIGVIQKRFCEDWGSYIKYQNGSLNAKYSVWAINLIAKFNCNYLCEIEIEKSSISSRNLLIDSVVAKSIIKISGINLGNIELKSMSFTHRIMSILNSSKYEIQDKIVIVGSEVNSIQSRNKLLNLVRLLNSIKKIYKIEYRSIEKLLIISTNNLFNNYLVLDEILEIK